MRTHRAYSTARRSHCPTWPIPGSRSISRLFGSSSPSTVRSRPPRGGQRPECSRLRRQSGADSAASERRSSGPAYPWIDVWTQASLSPGRRAVRTHTFIGGHIAGNQELRCDLAIVEASGHKDEHLPLAISEGADAGRVYARSRAASAHSALLAKGG